MRANPIYPALDIYNAINSWLDELIEEGYIKEVRYIPRGRIKDLNAIIKKKINGIFEVELDECDNYPDTKFIIDSFKQCKRTYITLPPIFLQLMRELGKQEKIACEFSKAGLRTHNEIFYDSQKSARLSVSLDTKVTIKCKLLLQSKFLADFGQFCRQAKFWTNSDPLQIRIDYIDSESPVRLRPFSLETKYLNYIVMPMKQRED